ncbi:MAG: hypothetical protein GF332_01735 [Candidatus Moranbacteria bacterium]|nr:hypothetical protein [Candidatus Moranbacteria bacterium]
MYPDWFFKFLYKYALKRIKRYKPSELIIYHGGSFLNDNEIPKRFQTYIYNEVRKNDFLDTLTIETRCEYINEKKIRTAKKNLGKKELKIALGFESQDNYIRNKLLRKGISKKQFESSVKLLKSQGVKVSVYVFLKPVGLNEKEAYIETIKSIEYLNSLKVDEINLSCAFVQKNTKMYTEYIEGNYKPPFLWTIIKIIEEAQKHNWPLLLGEFTDNPKPIDIPKNCEKCSEDIYKILKTYRRTGVLKKTYKCACYNDYKKTSIK